MTKFSLSLMSILLLLGLTSKTPSFAKDAFIERESMLESALDDPLEENVIYVDRSAAGDNDGTSWINAYTSLYDALLYANQNINIQEIYVAEGTYYPTGEVIASPTIGQRDSTFLISRSGIKLYGGYPSGGGTRNILTHVTILSGDIDNTPNDISQNSFHIMVIAGISSGSDSLVIDGFTFSKGSASGSATKSINGVLANRNSGAAIYIQNIVSNNYFVIRQCNFEQNNALGKGGGVYTMSNASSILFDRNTFTNNGAGFGGAIYSEESSSVVKHGIFRENNANFGGGLFYYNCLNSRVDQSFFLANIAIGVNSSNGHGGGIYNIVSQLEVANTIFHKNTADYYGGAMYNSSLSQATTVYNNTFAENTAQIGGAFYNFTNALVNIYNSILWNNTATTDNNIYTDLTSTTSVQFSLVEGYTYGANDLNNLPNTTNPLFFNVNNPAGADGILGTEDDGLRLLTGSLAIDAGDPQTNTPSYAVQVGSLDVASGVRIQNSIIDLGTYEGPASHTTLYVDASQGVSGGGGATWSTAYKTLSEALVYANAHTEVDTILVAEGTYYPTGEIIVSPTAGHRDSTFAITRSGLKIYGGYPAGGGTRDIAARATILSGDIDNTPDSVQNSFHVMVIAGITSNSDSLVIDGLTFTKGNANGSGSSYKMINGVQIDRQKGGSVYLKMNDSASSSRFMIRNCDFVQNNSTGSGGAIFDTANNVSYVKNTFLQNSATFGGGMFFEASSSRIEHSTFKENTANFGGGLFYYSSLNCEVTHSFFIENTAIAITASQGNGGAIYNAMSDLDVKNSVFYKNDADYFGGAMYNASLTVAMEIYNNTFVQNTAQTGGGIYNIYPAIVNIHNSIFWNNVADNENTMYNDMATNVSVQYSLAEGYSYNWNDENNLPNTTDPLFYNINNPAGADGIWGTEDDGLRLLTGSLAIDAGDAQTNALAYAVQVGSLDASGEVRIQNSIIDLGAYEGSATHTTLYVDASQSVSGGGATWSTAYKTLSEALVYANSHTEIDTILVAEGTYYPTGEIIASPEFGHRDSTFLITRGGLKLYGGYVSGGGERDINTYKTILSGDINNDNDTAFNSFHVMVVAGISDNSDSLVLDGLTIIKGNANNSISKDINGVLIYSHMGAGLVLQNNDLHPSTQIIVRNCDFNQNIAVRGGGALVFQSVVHFDNCKFTQNNSMNHGGAIYHSSVVNNLSLNQCSFLENFAEEAAGAIYTHSSNIENSLFYGNESKLGGAILVYEGTCNMANNTMVKNKANSGGAILTLGNVTLNNSILWGNEAVDNANISQMNSGEYSVQYSLVEDYAYSPSDLNNLPNTTNPLFFNLNNPAGADGIWGTEDDGLRLLTGSSAIDAGDPQTNIASYAVQVGPYDLTYGTRIQNSIIDLGAYEGAATHTALYVDASQSVSGGGATWSTAFKTLSEALVYANLHMEIDTILVAEGTYYPTGEIIASPEFGHRDSSFLITRGGLKLYGGYARGGGERDLKKYKTILSGDINNDNDTAFNSFHVMAVAGIADNSDSLVLDGLTFTKGNANNSAGSRNINGVLVNSHMAGGLTLQENDSSLVIMVRNSVFDQNNAAVGAGVIVYRSVVNFDNCLFTKNHAFAFGGAIYHSSKENRLSFKHCSFLGNFAGNVGGAIYTLFSDIDNCLFYDNESLSGGAIAIDDASFCNMTNSTLVNNKANSGGGILNLGKVVLNNSIVWGNEAANGANIVQINSGEYSVQYSLVGDYTYGSSDENNLPNNLNPFFLDTSNVYGLDGILGTADDGLRLQFCSPAINSGNNDSLPASITTDIAGHTRIIGATIDLGAYEKQSDVANFSNNAMLSSSASNTFAFLPVCEETDWIWYADPSNPDSLSFAIKWGNNNDAAKNAAQVLLSANTNNRLVSNDTSSATATMKRYWNVDLNGTTLTEPVSVRFFFDPADTAAMYTALLDENMGIPNSLIWFKTKDGLFDTSLVSYDSIENQFTELSGVYGASNGVAYIQFDNIASFSGGTAGMVAGSESPLPLTLLSFTAEGVNQKTSLKWKTADEKQMHSYEIERSNNGTAWNFLSSVLAKGNAENSYQAWDYSPVSGANLYRLKMKNNDGGYKYSQVVRVNFSSITNLDISIYPNPNKGTFTIAANGINQEVPMNIVDVLGRVVYAENITPGSNIVNVKGLVSGVYTVCVQADEVLHTYKLVIE